MASITLPTDAIASLGIIPRGPTSTGLSTQDLKVAVRRAQLTRLAREGLPASHAAKLVGISPDTARKDYRDPSFQRRVLGSIDAAYASTDEAFATQRQSIHAMLQEQAYRSFEDLVSMLEEPDLPKSLRVKINQDFLNRTPESAQHTTSTLRIDPSNLATAAAAAREMDAKVIPMKAVVPGGLETGDV